MQVSFLQAGRLLHTNSPAMTRASGTAIATTDTGQRCAARFEAVASYPATS